MKENLRDKLAKSSEMIQKILASAKNPAMLCSFGKDSMVLLAILRSLKKDFPVIFFKEPFFQEKYSFAHKMAVEWGLRVYDYPPVATAMANNGEKCEVIRQYQLGNQRINISSGNLYEPEEGEKFLCGKDDLLLKPLGGMNMPWDLLFCGHKSSDRDPLGGDLTLKVDVHQAHGMPMIAYPLREWTDKDVWTYLKAFNIPFDHNRYDEENEKDFEDKTHNSDWFPACTRCIDRSKDVSVICPKNGLKMTNFGNYLPHIDMKQTYYGKEKEEVKL
jgi:hypothetical protein